MVSSYAVSEFNGKFFLATGQRQLEKDCISSMNSSIKIRHLMADELLRCDIGRLDGGPNEAAPRLLVMKMPLEM